MQIFTPGFSKRKFKQQDSKIFVARRFEKSLERNVFLFNPLSTFQETILEWVLAFPANYPCIKPKKHSMVVKNKLVSLYIGCAIMGPRLTFHSVTRSIKLMCLKTIAMGTGICSLRSQSLATKIF